MMRHHLARRAPRLLALVVTIAALGGCSTTLTNMTAPHALEEGEVQMAVQMQATGYTNVIDKTIDAGEQAIDDFQSAPSNEPVSVETFRAYINGALAWLLFQPGLATEFMARIGVNDDILEGVDLGLRFDTNVVKGDLKLQLWEDPQGEWALALQGGYGYHVSVVDDVFEYVTLTEWSRHDFDFALSAGLELGDILKAWFAPRVIASRISVDRVTLPDFVESRLPAEVRDNDPSQLFEEEWMIYTGLTVGMMLGYKHLFATLELNVFHLDFDPTIVDEPQDFDSFVAAPAAGVTLIW